MRHESRIYARTYFLRSGVREIIRRNACVILLVETELPARAVLAQPNGILTVEQFPSRDVATAKPFALTDALGNRDTPAALLALRQAILAGKDPIELLGLVAWQLQRWVVVKRLLDAGQSIPELIAATGLKQSQLQRIQSELNHRSLDVLTELLNSCWELDVAIRSGRLMPELAIEQLVCQVCLLKEATATARAVTSRTSGSVAA